MLISTLQAVPAHQPDPVSSSSTRPTHEERSGIRGESQEESTEQGVPASGIGEQSAEERRVVAELQRTDREVRAHEAAHLAAAGGLARGVSFSYTTGPDGRQYAVAGEVSIDTSPVPGDPAATARKAQQIRAAATAPANPSSQDFQAAAQASQLEQAARIEEAAQEREELDKRHRGSQASSFEPLQSGGGLDVVA